MDKTIEKQHSRTAFVRQPGKVTEETDLILSWSASD